MPLSLLFSICTNAQEARTQKPEEANCVIRINADGGKAKGPSRVTQDKVYNVGFNRRGHFRQVPNIKPSAKVFIELGYPAAKAGEKVVVSVLDGGMLDNGKRVKVLVVSTQRKCPFGFQVSDDLGSYRLLVRKGNDVKVVQLWVGPEPPVTKN
ncbi:MAG TPA: hypothetical protein VD996_15405 [Chitinophagaceae bacterium]|nr:hypothetical protein [Chitinophagaceae bacterium]